MQFTFILAAKQTLQVLNWGRQAGGFAVNTASGMEAQADLRTRYEGVLALVREQDKDIFVRRFLLTGLWSSEPLRVIGKDNRTYLIRFGGSNSFTIDAVPPVSPEEVAAALPWISATYPANSNEPFEVPPMWLRDP